MQELLNQLKAVIDTGKNIVFFGGAGVSTESGIPDFRSVDGLYNQKYSFSPEEILSHSYFLRDPETFFRFHKEKMICTWAKPNAAHYYLAGLERKGKLRAVITQNIDELHQKAGSLEVLELHGSVYRNYCMRCRKNWPISYVINAEGVPKCDCGGIVRPDVVLYEESLNGNILAKAVEYIENADVMIVGGTSLVVYPAASLLTYFRGNKLVLINESKTAFDAEADLAIPMKIGEVFSALDKMED